MFVNLCFVELYNVLVFCVFVRMSFKLHFKLVI